VSSYFQNILFVYKSIHFSLKFQFLFVLLWLFSRIQRLLLAIFASVKYGESMKLNELNKRTLSLDSQEQMPVLFVGHGSPMNAIEDNEFVQGWKPDIKILLNSVSFILSS